MPNHTRQWAYIAENTETNMVTCVSLGTLNLYKALINAYPHETEMLDAESGEVITRQQFADWLQAEQAQNGDWIADPLTVELVSAGLRTELRCQAVRLNTMLI